MSKKVLIGMSGGVDSSVAAALLQDQGYDVTGVTFLLCPGASSAASQDAARVAGALGIRHETVDFTDLFRREVMDYFVSEYQRGRTPNPCIVCNRKIKFGRFLKLADERGADFIATGHYARIGFDDRSGAYCLYASEAKGKDQSYFLYTMTQRELSRTLMPLSGMDKDKTRALARSLGLPVAEKPDSQDVCFIPDGDYIRFLEEYADYRGQEGPFRSADGEILGWHKGIAHYTIGQRKGLGTAFGKPMFVTGLDASANTVYLGEKGTEYTQEFTASGLCLTGDDAIDASRPLACKIRYAAPLAPCVVTLIGGGRLCVRMKQPARAVTPGQSVVFYDGNRVVGGAVIDDMY